ncbi:hypothetical protein AOG1_26830 [Geobacter sp. AOG1]|nr:hypothetical protein AOG1_26830 [Geobacter sp. AOG1]
MFLIVFVVALPAAGIIIHLGVKLRNEVYDQARLDSQKIVDRIVTEQQNLVLGAEQLMTAVAQLPDVKQHDAAKTVPILTELRKLNPMYSNIFIADRDGTVWATAVTVTGHFNVADRRYFKNALASGKMSSGEYLISRATSKPAFNFASPLRDDKGTIVGVISVGFIIDHYRELLGRMQSPAGTNAVLIDHQGIIISRAVNPEPFIGKKYFPEVFRRIQEGPEAGTSVRAGLGGDMRIISHQKLRLKDEQTPYMYATVGIPVEVVLTRANKVLLYNVVLFMSVLTVAFILAWRIGKRSIVDRVALLEKASQRLANGDLDVRVSDYVLGGELGNLGQAFDTMARQLALREQALRERESSYRDIFNTTRDALFVHDADSGKIIEVNKAAENMFGYNREEMLHALPELGTGEPPYSSTELVRWIQKSVKEGPQKFEWLSKRKNGELFWSEVVLSASSSVGERRVLAVGRDITERKEIERVKDEMLSAVSHEMRTPLTAMLGFLQFVRENPVDEVQLRDYHGIMYKEAERLNELIGTFLDMQRFRAKQKNVMFKPLAVRPLLDEAAAIFTGPSCKHRITVDLPPDLPQIYGDETLLHQALSNLLSNAIKYSPSGSAISLGARGDDDSVILWIKDEGIGIPAGSLDKIFETFYRLDNTARRQVGGTGLGLALVKEIVTAHGGRVWVESTIGKGSTFFVSLPVACG